MITSSFWESLVGRIRWGCRRLFWMCTGLVGDPTWTGIGTADHVDRSLGLRSRG